MTDRDIIIVYIKEYSMDTEEYKGFEQHIKQVNEDDTTKIIVLPNDIVEGIERA